MDVPGTLDLGDHDHLELVPDLSHELGDVVEEVGRGELVDTRPQRGFAEVHLTPDLDQTGARGLLLFERDGVLEVAEQDVHLGARSGVFSTIFGFEKSMKWIIRDGLNGISRAGSGASIARGLKKSRGLRKAGLLGFGCGPNGTASTSGRDDLLETVAQVR